MSPKTVVGLLLLLVALLGIGKAWSNYQDKKEASVRDIRIKVQSAKTRGEKKLQLPAPIPFYAGVHDLDDALGHYSTVIAYPTLKHSQLNADSTSLETWYKFKVTDFLSQPEKPHVCESCKHAENIPPEVLPVNEDELIVKRGGGSLEVDGVRVYVQDASFPDYQIGQKYFLFLIVDLNSRTASVELGPQGVSLINSNGKLDPVGPPNTKLNASLQKRFARIDDLRDALKFRKFARQQ